MRKSPRPWLKLHGRGPRTSLTAREQAAKDTDGSTEHHDAGDEQQQGVRGDHRDDFRNPLDKSRDERGNVGEQRGHRNSGRLHRAASSFPEKSYISRQKAKIPKETDNTHKIQREGVK